MVSGKSCVSGQAAARCTNVFMRKCRGKTPCHGFSLAEEEGTAPGQHVAKANLNCPKVTFVTQQYQTACGSTALGEQHERTPIETTETVKYVLDTSAKAASFRTPSSGNRSRRLEREG